MGTYFQILSQKNILRRDKMNKIILLSSIVIGIVIIGMVALSILSKQNKNEMEEE